MDQRHLRVVGEEGTEPITSTEDPSDDVSVLDVTPERDPIVPGSDMWIRVEPLGEPAGTSRPITDPNTGERITHPSMSGGVRRAAGVPARPAADRDSRLREYLRLVEGS